MKDLTNEEKVSLIIELCKKHDITAYEIGEKTSVSNVAAHNILTGATENPRGKTLNVILEYIEERITGKNVPGHKNYEKPEFPHIFAEEAAKYGKDVQRIISMLRDIQITMRVDHDAIAEGVQKIYLNTEDIKDGNVEMSVSISNLITTLNRGSSNGS